MSTVIHRWVEAAQRGTNPRVVCRAPSGWIVLGDPQVSRGYALLLPDPVVPHLNALEGPAREQFWRDLGTLGDALLEVTGAARINYELLGNLEPALHGHAFPRYLDEPEALRTKPIWFHDWDGAPAFDPQAHAPLLGALRAALARRLPPA